MPLQSYQDLIVWQKSMELVEQVYIVTRRLPKEETFALTNQIRRAAISIPSNIAEGYKRQGSAEYIHFLSIADASLAELETQALLIHRLYPEVATQPIQSLAQEVGKMFSVLIKKLKQNQ